MKIKTRETLHLDVKFLLFLCWNFYYLSFIITLSPIKQKIEIIIIAIPLIMFLFSLISYIPYKKVL